MIPYSLHKPYWPDGGQHIGALLRANLRYAGPRPPRGSIGPQARRGPAYRRFAQSKPPICWPPPSARLDRPTGPMGASISPFAQRIPPIFCPLRSSIGRAPILRAAPSAHWPDRGQHVGGLLRANLRYAGPRPPRGSIGPLARRYCTNLRDCLQTFTLRVNMHKSAGLFTNIYILLKTVATGHGPDQEPTFRRFCSPYCSKRQHHTQDNNTRTPLRSYRVLIDVPSLRRTQYLRAGLAIAPVLLIVGLQYFIRVYV